MVEQERVAKRATLPEKFSRLYVGENCAAKIKVVHDSSGRDDTFMVLVVTEDSFVVNNVVIKKHEIPLLQ